MTAQDILSHVDHTLLRADATWPDIRRLCEETLRYHTASVCIPSSFVRRAHEAFPALTICTVVGFPLGNASLAAKEAETRQALADGAAEIDMVIPIGTLKNGETDTVTAEIRALLQKYGASKLSQIDPAHYKALLAEAEVMTDGS